ncbi:MAG: flagellar protein FlaG [Lachnoclostridium sp.]|nr:flagellar protein FlaG [Lachnoclostridium sp.]
MDIETVSSVGKVAMQQPVQVQQSVPVHTPVQQPSNVRVDESANAGFDSSRDERNGELEKKLSENTVRETVSSVNAKMGPTRCEFSYHKGTKRVSIKVFDKDTDEVIREVPPEKSLEMLQKMWELAGLFVDERQ